MEPSKNIQESLPVRPKHKGLYFKIINQKLNTHDWLRDIELPHGQKQFDIVEVSFKKGSRKGFYRNSSSLKLESGTIVAVEAKTGHDVGMITLSGPLITKQMKKKKVSADSETILKIYRVATDKDISIWEEAQADEHRILVRSRQIALAQKLKMKISDIEYQGDKKKIIFYFIAEGRIDFRELVKLYVGEFRAKIEMRQISLRQEAALVGGLGPCGNELCCTTWMTDFKTVTNAAVRVQNLDMNPDRLASPCGRLKCCINFEVETYKEAMEAFPKNIKKLETKKGEAKLIKKDILKKEMVFKYSDSPTMYTLDVSEVIEIAAMNAKGEHPEDLRKKIAVPKEIEEETTADIIEEVKIEQLGRKKKKKKRWFNRRKR